MSRRFARYLQLAILFTAVLFGYSISSDSAFALWRDNFQQFALQQGIQAGTLDLAFRGLLPDQKVLRLDSHQPEFSRPVWEYLDSAVSPERITQGRKMLQEHADLLEKISTRYRVEKEYIVAIWGMESSYGIQTGNYSVIRSLATLAYQGREGRREFWEQQLIGALRILQEGDMSLLGLRGSWAGAIGHTQFIPTTFEAYAVDFDGDGRRNIVGSISDALASTANYLTNSDWRQAKKWGEEVRLPESFDWMQADPANVHPLDYWVNQMHLVRVDGTPIPVDPDEQAFVFLPAGYRGPAFLVYRNFRAILKYNNALNYAMAVGYLGDSIREGSGPKSIWPRDEVSMSHLEKAELQELLSAVGYNTDGIDGRIGPNTRAALRRWQADVGFPADGYPTLAHLQLLREQAELRVIGPRLEAGGSM